MGTADLVERVLRGEVRAAARLMRDLDDRLPEGEAALRALFPRTGRAHVVGLTGAPGSGKSTLTDRLIAHHRAAGRTVGVVAVDPTSPFSGGAILGDRIRMQDHALDPGVFIRSLGTRGHLGGLSRSTSEMVQVLDAMGKDVVLVETVGVGQDEIEVAELAHTVVVLAVPGLGDDVQAIKAGVLEIADVFAVNKADREGADRAVRDLQTMLELRRTVLGRPSPAHDADHHPGEEPPAAAPGGFDPDLGWEPPILRTVAVRGEGIEELAAAIEAHRAHLESSGGRRLRDVARARASFVALLRERLLAGALARLEAETGHLDEVAARIAAREADPWALAEEMALRLRA
ncbi:MAG TPA: methylmalonyl Co-A mutase-associated GTPase MeaB [Anaeromyxobacteraceae bacterium]|nr:methylmalonyl Co-A mutase-associated GTPase MeaB [Anaeromyxobacteraceae bacterium]